jgi:hypothetical protein
LNTRVAASHGKYSADVNDAHISFGINDGTDVIDPESAERSALDQPLLRPELQAIEEDDGRVFIHALRNIRAGEELSYDYQLSGRTMRPRSKLRMRHCGGKCAAPWIKSLTPVPGDR